MDTYPTDFSLPLEMTNGTTTYGDDSGGIVQIWVLMGGIEVQTNWSKGSKFVEEYGSTQLAAASNNLDSAHVGSI
jgi:hypothetical protein